jgi:hypothetical protein
MIKKTFTTNDLGGKKEKKKKVDLSLRMKMYICEEHEKNNNKENSLSSIHCFVQSVAIISLGLSNLNRMVSI